MGHSHVQQGSLRLAYFSNEFPSDDLVGLLRRLHNHSKDASHPLLANFLQEATRAVRNEVGGLPQELAKLVPAFDSVLTLADDATLRKGSLGGSIDGVLLCVLQLGTYIGSCEAQPDKSTDAHDQVLAGLGIGLLASAALSIAPTTQDLPLAAAEVVRIAFRLGVVVSEVSSHLEASLTHDGPPESWAYVVHEVSPEDAQKELDTIHAREGGPATAKIFISALSRNSVTVSGPPSRLQALFRTSGFFRDRRYVVLPVYSGLCHAGHIYTSQHVDRVVDVDGTRLPAPRTHLQAPVISTSSGKPFPARDATDLLREIVTEILTQTIEFDNVVQGLVERNTKTQASHLDITCFRVSLPITEFISAYNASVSDATCRTEDLISWLVEPSPLKAQPRGPAQSKIAIVGMACRTPGAASTEAFWDILEAGRDMHSKIPADRFDVTTHCDPEGKRVNASHTEYGCFVDEPGLFDAPFFNMSPREAQQTDPMQRLALVTAYEALERAGYVAGRTAATNPSRIGTWYGQASDDYREVNTAQDISTYFIPGGCRAFGPGRINYFFKFEGPSFSCDTACSSSLAAIQAACTSLWSGEVDTVVAGGTNILTNSDAFAGLSHGHFLTKTPNACKTWDSEADGYCRADAVGSLVLKRLEDAEADNDHIFGVILGAGTNHSANAVSITHPHTGAQSQLYRQVLHQAGTDPLDVSFIEMHGTGTQAGDGVEMKSVTDVFAPLTRRRNAKQPLHIGAVKSNIGHAEAASGVTAMIKIMMMLQKSAIPPHVGIKHAFSDKLPKDLSKRNVHIPFEKVAWLSSPDKKRTAVVNNFSAAGGNTTILLEEGSQVPVSGTDSRPCHVVAVSAKSKISLKGNVERLVAYLDRSPEISLADLAYTTTARRYHHNQRMAFPVTNVPELRQRLTASLDTIETHKPIPNTGAPSVAFVFTGQGSSDRSMHVQLFRDVPSFRIQLMHLDSIAQHQGFPSFLPAIDGTYAKDYAHSPVVTQIALTCLEISLAKYWESLGVKPDVVLGHSLGEYAAFCVAGVLSAADAIFLVGTRARMLQSRCERGSHRMTAVNAAVEVVRDCLTDKTYEIACINGPKSTVISGTLNQMMEASAALTLAGHRCLALDVDYAFHSTQTDAILDDFEAVAESVIFKEPTIPVISPLLGRVIFDDETLNANYLRRATRESVNFPAALGKAQAISIVDKDTAWVEIGPHPVSVGFVKSIIPDVKITSASLRRGEDNWTTLSTSLALLHGCGVEIAWSEFHQPFEKSALRLLDLPTYAWNAKTYWIQYNGDWALTKGNTFYESLKAPAPKAMISSTGSSIKTSTVQQIIEESFEGRSGKVVMQSDLMQPDFLAAAHGHNMNGCGVVTSSIHADIAYTLGEHLWSKLMPKSKKVGMDIINLEVTKGLVAQNNTKTPQLIQVVAATEDVTAGVTLTWHNVDNNGTAHDPFATARIQYGDMDDWLDSWSPLAHFIEGRIDVLQRLAAAGSANRFSQSMAYTLFASNLVDYAQKYRGMQSVVLSGFEAFADVTLTTDKGGNWTVPPFFIDSVAHLAGFVMNVSDASDTANTFCVTPGWQSMRFARPLTAGQSYRSYVKMIPTTKDATVFLGDVYILQEGTIMGLVQGIQFRRYPRILLNRFFSPPDSAVVKGHTSAASTAVAPSKKPVGSADIFGLTKNPGPAKVMSMAKERPDPASTNTVAGPTTTSVPKAPTPAPVAQPASSADADSTSSKAMLLIADEIGVEPGELLDDNQFADIGVDSLMSLVISEKFRDKLGITVGGSLFLEYPSIGALRAWLEEYYN